MKFGQDSGFQIPTKFGIPDICKMLYNIVADSFKFCKN